MKFLVLSTLVLGLIAKCFGQPAQNIVPFRDIFGILLNTILPQNAFNASCMRTSCPQLANPGLCPYGTDGKINCAALTKVMSILTACPATKVCGTQMDPIAFPPTTGIFNPSIFGIIPLSLSCSSYPNSIVLKGLTQAVFSVADDGCSSDGCLLITITNPKVHLDGFQTCELSINDPSGLIKINKTLPISYSYDLSVSGTVRLNCNGTQTSAVQPAIKITFEGEKIFNVTLPVAFNYIVNRFLANTRLSVLATSYISNLAESAIQATCLANA